MMTTRYDPRSGIVEIFSRVRDESPAWVARARGHMRVTDAAPASGLSAPTTFDRHFDRTSFYEQTALHGLHYGHAFTQAGAIVKFQHWHVAKRIDGVEIAAIGQLVAANADLDRFKCQAGLLQCDMRRQRAGTGGVIQLH